MDLINKQLTNTHLNTISDETINSKFLQTFNEIFSYENNNIKVIGTMDKPWFRAKDILKILGYSQNAGTIKNFIHKYIPEEYKKPMGELIDVNEYNESKEIYINKTGLTHLLCKSKKMNKEPVVIWFNEKFNLNLNLVNFTYEQKTIGVIKKIYEQAYKTECQYQVDKYYIDLYIPELKLAIECDEFNHSGYKNDDKREEYIKEKLDCKFIRFNPNSKDFDIFNVLSKITIYIKNFYN